MNAPLAGLSLAVLVVSLATAMPVVAAEVVRYEPAGRDPVKLEPKPGPESVDVLEKRPPRPIVTIGRVWVRAEPTASKEDLITLLRAKAAEVGADFLLLRGLSERTTHHRGPSGGTGGGINMRGMSVTTQVLFQASVGVYAKTSLGLLFEPFNANWGRPFVRGFTPASKAAAAGVQVGDQILAIEGIPYHDEGIRHLALRAMPGQIVKVEVRRGESNLVLEIPLVPE